MNIRIFLNILLAVFFLALFTQKSLGEVRGTVCARVAVIVGTPRDQLNQQLTPGQVLLQGARIRTGENAYVKLILKDESILDLGPSSAIKLVACETPNKKVDIDLELELGSVRANVAKPERQARKDFKLRTPTSVLGVRGTEFFVSWQKDSSGVVTEQIGVSKGQIEVTSLFDQKVPSIPLGAGTEFKAEGKLKNEGGQTKVEVVTPPQVDQFSAQEQRQFEEGTKVEQKPFEQAVELPPATEAKNEKGKEKAETFLVAKLQEKAPERGPSSESQPRNEKMESPGGLPQVNEKKEDPRKNNLDTLAPGSGGALPPRPGNIGNDVNLNGIPIYTTVNAIWAVKSPRTK